MTFQKSMNKSEMVRRTFERNKDMYQVMKVLEKQIEELEYQVEILTEGNMVWKGKALKLMKAEEMRSEAKNFLDMKEDDLGGEEE